MNSYKKILILVTIIISILSCQTDNIIGLSLNNGDIFNINEMIEVDGSAGSSVDQIDVFLNNSLTQTITPSNNAFVLRIDTSVVGKFNLVLKAKSSAGDVIFELNSGYEVADKVKKPTPTPTPPPGTPGGDNWSSFDFPKPTNSELGSMKNLWATYYRLPRVSELSSGGYPLKNKSGQAITKGIALKDWCDAAMEGSVIVSKLDGSYETYNFAASTGSYDVNCKRFYPHKTGRTKFQKAKGIYGDGVKGFNLVPFRSIAVDRSIIPYGTLLYIPEAVGTLVTLPNGQQRSHDGYFFSADTGSAIKKSHVDVYIATNLKNPFRFVKSKPSQKFRAYIVKNKAIYDSILNNHLNLR